LNEPIGYEEEEVEQEGYSQHSDGQHFSDYHTEYEGSHNNNSIGPIGYQEQDLNGPVNRQIRIYVKTLSDRMDDSESPEPPLYNDNVTRCNANARCRKYGVPVCNKLVLSCFCILSL